MTNPESPAMPIPTASVPVPPEDLRERVTGTKDPVWFVESGAGTVSEWLQALASAKVRFQDCATVVDFGCGCGRTLRHLAPMLYPSQRLVGLDNDQAAVAWVTKNVPGVECFQLGAMPPAPLSDASVDLILSHSVFTHLPEDVQNAWLKEMARLLRPGSVLIASFHGRKVEHEFVATNISAGREDFAAAFASTMDSTGFFHIAGRSAVESSFQEYYGAAFHRIDYIVQHWLDDFDLVKWFPVYALGHQDVVVLRRKPTGA